MSKYSNYQFSWFVRLYFLGSSSEPHYLSLCVCVILTLQSILVPARVISTSLHLSPSLSISKQSTGEWVSVEYIEREGERERTKVLAPIYLITIWKKFCVLEMRCLETHQDKREREGGSLCVKRESETYKLVCLSVLLVVLRRWSQSGLSVRPHLGRIRWREGVWQGGAD